MNETLFISILPQDINTRRYKNRYIYSWFLERLNHEKKITSALEINPSEPSKYGIQKHKTKLLQNLIAQMFSISHTNRENKIF